MSSTPRLQALVTGAGSALGIGYAIARRLAEDGFSVAITSTTERIHERAAALRAAGHPVRALVGDLTSLACARALRAELGPVSVLVNNAGMGRLGAPARPKAFVDYTEADWDESLAMTLKTAFCATRAFLPDMLAAGYGRIVNVASVTGPYVANPHESAYAAAKAGMVGLTRALALEVAGRGVTVTAVAPGWIDTAASSDEEREAGRHTPAGRAGTPEEVAHAVSFLASAGASYVNGETLVVDGANIVQESKGPAAGGTPP